MAQIVKVDVNTGFYSRPVKACLQTFKVYGHVTVTC